jgi:hypothetical protein
MMNRISCREVKKALSEAGPGGPAPEGLRRHLEGCPACRREAERVGMIMDAAAAFRDELREAESGVDWEAFALRVASRAIEHGRAAEKVEAGRRPGRRRFFSPLVLRPVLAGLAAGLVLGSLAMFLALRDRGAAGRRPQGFYASADFIDRLEAEVARRQVLEYLEKSQFILRDIYSGGGPYQTPAAAFGAGEVRELLNQKRYLNPQLEKFRMAKAKAVCDQIELLFQELAQLSEEMTPAEVERIRSLIEERRLLLKINIIKKEIGNEV